VKTLALKLLDKYDEHISSKVLLSHEMRFWEWPFNREDTPRGFTGLHGAAYLGCVEIMIALLDTNKWDVQATDHCGNTAIIWAARGGHEEAVRVLLEQSKVDPDRGDKCNRTPLWWAACNGHKGVVRTLLAQENVNPNQVSRSGETPLGRAAIGGHEVVVGMLLERNDVDLNKGGGLDQAPLWLASGNGRRGVVRMLLARMLLGLDDIKLNEIISIVTKANKRIQGYAGGPQSAGLFFPHPSELSKPSSKSTRS